VNTNEPRIDADQTAGTAAALRRLFDQGFAAPAASKPERLEDLLAIRVGADPYALRLSEVAGLHVDVKIVPVPSPVAALLGVVALRGMLAPVYDLAALLGYPAAASPRWMVLAGVAQRVGFAFEAFEEHVQVPQASLAGGEEQGAGGGAAAGHARGSVRAAGALRPVIHLASMVQTIRDNNS